jgi:hypothetical protein
MPDSTPPFGWGPAAFDDWDLDDLLSGRLAVTPPALRQVAEALGALRAAPPTPSELSGEAAVMAEFSALFGYRGFGPRETARARDQADTLVLPAQPSRAARAGRAHAPRHRGRPARRRPLSWQAGALMGATAAIVIVTVVAFGGRLPGPIKSFANVSTSSPQATHPAPGNSESQNVAAKSAASMRPSPSHPASTQPAAAQLPAGATLCRTWFADFLRPQSHSNGRAEFSLFLQLIKLAHGPDNVFSYCTPWVKDMFPHENLWFHGIGQSSHEDGQGGNGSDGGGSGSGDSASPSPSSSGSDGSSFGGNVSGGNGSGSAGSSGRFG